MAGPRIWNIVRLNRDPLETFAGESLGDAIDLADPDADDIVEFGTVKAADAGAARLLKPKAWRELVRRGDDWWTKNPDGTRVSGSAMSELHGAAGEFARMLEKALAGVGENVAAKVEPGREGRVKLTLEAPGGRFVFNMNSERVVMYEQPQSNAKWIQAVEATYFKFTKKAR